MNIRRPYVAGSFYPGDKNLLRNTIEKFLNNAEIFEKEFFAFICPHAGYPYSGQTAGYVYRQVKEMNKVDTVLLLGVSHNAMFDYIALDGNEEWETPLGKVLVDKDLVDELSKDKNFRVDSSPHEIEHSLEVQVPFIQMIDPSIKIVPLLIGSSDLNLFVNGAEKLFEVYKNRNFLLIVSSDMYHGYSYDECKKYDTKTRDVIAELNWEKFYNLIDKEVMACGAYAITLLLRFCELMGESKTIVLHHTNSADVTGSYYGYVVGYLSMGFYK